MGQSTSCENLAMMHPSLKPSIGFNFHLGKTNRSLTCYMWSLLFFRSPHSFSRSHSFFPDFILFLEQVKLTLSPEGKVCLRFLANLAFSCYCGVNSNSTFSKASLNSQSKGGSPSFLAPCDTLLFSFLHITYHYLKISHSVI